MLALVVSIEVKVASSVKSAQALYLVFHSMGVNNIHDDSHASGMGIVNEVFQFLESAEA